MAFAKKDQGLKDAVIAAVDAAAKAGNVSKADIMRMFEGKAHPTTIFRWIAKRMQETAISDAIRDASKQEIATRIADDANRGARAIADARATAQNPFEHLLLDGIEDSIAAIALGKTDDGRIRNPKLIRESREAIRKHVHTAAMLREQETLSEQEMRDFVRDLKQVIRQEPKEVQERIVGRMRAIRQSSAASVF